MSKYEEHIAQIINKAGLSFSREVIFRDLRRRQPLRFDFQVFISKDHFILIEVDGEQHWKEIWGKHSDLIKRQEYDRIKNSYCLARDIELYRIPYWDIYTLNNFQEIYHNNKFLVKSKWHNDNISCP